MWNYRIGIPSRAPASGSIYLDDIFFRALPAPNSTNWTELIPFHSTWRYSASTPPANWFAPDFVDAAWPLGTAKFGAGSGPANIVTTLPQRQPVYYFRRNFVLGSLACEELLLSATCTDAGNPPDIYLNGTKLNTSGIDIVSNPGNEIRYFDLTPFADLLHAGNNTIAVALKNVWATDWDDIAFDMDLKAVTERVDCESQFEHLRPVDPGRRRRQWRRQGTSCRKSA